LKLGRSARGEVQANYPVVVAVLATVDEPGGCGPVDDADCAVVAE
jgi:hypothetical protein